MNRLLGKTHIILGIIATSSLMSIRDPEGSLIVLGAGIAGSLMPDIDHKESIIRKTLRLQSRIYYELIAMALIAGLIFEVQKSDNLTQVLIALVAMIITSIYMTNKTGHRGITHSLMGLTVFTLIIHFVLKQAVLPFAIAYGTHLVADLMTNSGILLFYPGKLRLKLGLFDTGSSFEKVVYWIGIGVLWILVYQRLSKAGVFKSFY